MMIVSVEIELSSFLLLLIPQVISSFGRCFGVGTRCLSFCVCLRGKEGERCAEREGSEEQQVKGKSETETKENRGKGEESVGDETNGIGGERKGLKEKGKWMISSSPPSEIIIAAVVVAVIVIKRGTC